MADRRARRAATSPLVTLLALGLVAIPGFALGLVAGVAWQDPGLLAAHWTGGTEEVAWTAPPLQAEPEQVEPPASPAAPQAPEASPAALPAVAAAPTPTPPAPAARPEAPAPAGRFAVQVGAFSESATAERLAAALRGKGFRVYVSPGAAAGAARWRVRVGPLPTRGEAEAVAGALKRDEKLPTWVLDEDGAV